jgi:hypothetical protein
VLSRRFSPEAVAAVALVFLYLLVANGHLQSIDGLVMYRQGVSLAYQHSLHWSPPIDWGDPRTTSSYGIGLSLLYIPGLLVFSWLQPHMPLPHGSYDFSLLYSDPVWPLAGMPVHILVVAAGAYLVARLVRALGFGTGPAMWALVLFGIGSPAIVYARADTAQLLEGLCWIGAIYAAISFRRTDRQRWIWGCGIALFFALLTRPLEGLLIAPAAAVLFIPDLRPWRWTRSVWTGAAIVAGWEAAAVAVTLAVNVGRFGGPLNFGSPTSWTTPLPVGLAGALISPARGMLWAFPAIVLVPLGLRRLWGDGHRWPAAVIAILCGALLLNVSLWTFWWGGWSWGLRLFLPALPLLAVLAAVGITALPAGMRRWLPGLLLAGGVLWAVPGVFTDILGGYAGAYNGTDGSFRLSGYPPIGAWQFVHHLRAYTLPDSSAVDLVWLRISRLTHNLSLIPPVLIAIAGAALLTPLRRSMRDSQPALPQRGREKSPAISV